MTSEPQRFAGPAARPLRFGLCGFLVALCGAVLAAFIDYGPNNPWAFVAFAIVCIGVAMGVVAVAWGWVAIIRHSAQRLRDDTTNP